MSKAIKAGIVLVIVGLLGSVIFLVQGFEPLMNRMEAEGKPIKLHKTADGKDMKMIKVDSNSATIQLHESTNEQVQARLSGSIPKQDNIRLSTVVQEQTLTIRVDYQYGTRPFLQFASFHNPKLDVTIPKKVYDLLQLQTDNGDIKADQLLEAKDVTLFTQNGMIDISGIKSKQVKGTSDNSDINLHDVVAESLTMNTGSGSLSLDGYQGNNVIGRTDSGDIRVTNSDGTYDLRSEDGNVEVSLLHGFKGKNRFTTGNGNIQISTNTAPTVLQVLLKSDNGRIVSDFPINTSQTNNNDGSKPNSIIEGSIGEVKPDSPDLYVKTDSGDIELKR